MVITPLIVPAVFVGIYATYFSAMGFNRPGLSWSGSLLFSYLFGVPLGYLAIGALGWPWVTKLRQWQRLTVGNVCLGAVVIGMLSFFAFALVVGHTQSILQGAVERLAMGLTMGLIAGLIFCGIAGVPLRLKR
jgi:hypothetical protein